MALAWRVRRLGGPKRCCAAFAAGAASVLAMAPFFAFPVLWLTLPVLVWLIDGTVQAPADCAPVRKQSAMALRAALSSAAAGWWFGFGYFLAGLFWVADAFLVDAQTFGFLLPVAVTLLPAGMALYYGAAAGIARFFWREGWERVLALALALSGGEWLRGHLFSGFPWNVIGYALTYPLALMQSAAYLGIYGLSFCAVLIFALPAVLWSGAPEGRGGRVGVVAAALAVLPLAVAALLGELRLAATPAMVPGVLLRIVQPNVPQREKWLAEFQERNFRDHLALSLSDASGKVDGAAAITHIVWPEAALPFLVLEHGGALAAIGRMLPPGALLFTGSLRAEGAPAGSGRPQRIFNSILVLGAQGRLLAHYDKIHLVPFGEYLPMQGALEAIGLSQLARLRGGFAPGAAPRLLLRAPGLPPSSPLICYEAVFPHAIVETGERPGLLLNVTNDGWFGDTTGPRQHFHQARVRAVEEGVALVRAANNGISALVDPQGRVLHRLDLNVRGTIDAELPRALPPPPYARFGDWLFLALWLGGLAAFWLRHRHTRAPRPHEGD